MAIKNSDLYSAFWARCDELHGGLDAGQYKDYALVTQHISCPCRSRHGKTQ